jgi:Ca2+/Na+ antiporter
MMDSKEDTDPAVLPPSLEAREELAKKKLAEARTGYYSCFLVGIFFLIVCLFFLLSAQLRFLAWVLFLFPVLFLTLLPMLRSSVRSAEEEIRDVQFEIDLLRFASTQREGRAEKLMRINQYELKRYYDQNLTQSSWIFVLGVFSIIFGVGIICYTLFLLHSSTLAAWQDKAVIGVVGTLGSILTNFVAAIYLKMYTETATSLVTFHSKLVDIHQLFFANLLASLITDDKERTETLAKLSVAIVSGSQRHTTSLEK